MKYGKNLPLIVAPNVNTANVTIIGLKFLGKLVQILSKVLLYLFIHVTAMGSQNPLSSSVTSAFFPDSALMVPIFNIKIPRSRGHSYT